ncbi:MAG: hypothetical protein HY554_00970 [Elusimicrobia bacterium]|nr:hypothetical protein [Elusimicrobiota bacterium]
MFNPYYTWLRGADQPAARLLACLRAVLALACFLAAGLVVDWAAQTRRLSWSWLPLLGSLLIVGSWLTVPEGPRDPLILHGPALPVCVAALLGVAVWSRSGKGGRWPSPDWARQVAPWAVFSLAAMAKVLLRVSLASGQSLPLAMPAAILVAVSLARWAPDLLARWYGGGRVFRALVLLALLAEACAVQWHSRRTYLRKTLPVGAGGDTVWTFGPDVAPQGLAARMFLEKAAARLPPEAPLLVLPGSMMLNYLARRVSPIPYVNVQDGELLMYGEERIIDSIRENGVEYIALVHLVSLHGTFGLDDYYGGRRLLDWVRRNYVPIERIMNRPLLRRDEFGIELLKKRA